MQPNILQASNTLLTYSLTTKPMPVQVSLSTTTISVATLMVVVSCPESVGAAMVSQIKISLPVDTTGYPPDPTNLCMTPPALSSASISSSGTDQWVVSAGVSPGDFIFKPKSGPIKVSAQALTIEFTGIQVNTVVGTALVTINEWAAPGTGTPPPVTGPPSGTQSVAIAKFPYGFYAGNFTSNKPMVQNSEKPVLSWSGSSNATYLILYEANAPINVTNVRTWSPPAGLTQMTTFILQVSAQQAGQTATMDFSITVEVANPSVVAQDLTVGKTSNLKGAVTVGTSAAPANLVVNGDVQGNNLSAVGTLNAKKDATLDAKLNVASDTTLRSKLNVSGLSTLSDVDATGNVTLRSSTTIQGSTSIFGVPKKYDTGTYTAQTDGFVIGVIVPPSQQMGPYYFNATIVGSTNGIWVYATGGGWTSCVNPPNLYGAPMSGSFLLPVRKGDKWSVGLFQPWISNPPAPPSSQYSFYFVPLGTSFSALGGTMEASDLMGLIPTPPPGEAMMLNLSSHPEVQMPKKRAASKKKATSKKKAAAKKKPAARKKTRKR